VTTVTSQPLADLSLARGTVDRAARHRTDDAWLARRWRDPASRVLIVDGGTVAVDGDPPALALVSPADAGVDGGAHPWLLGVDDDGTAIFGVVGRQSVGRPATLREVGALLSDREAALMTTAVALESWHASHAHCPRCGAPTMVREAGLLRVCPVDGSLQHPRVDPAVIMAVVDADDRLLLGHQARWPARRFSTLAGFVEPGESLEQAVRREVHEETSVTVDRVTYLGSQPWPFPRSLMVGFIARATTTTIVTDDVEIVDARWFTRRLLRAVVADGDVILPPRVSIARRLIERWHGGPFDEPATEV
jgi:NAD+ diphosphatase